jgi:hypothetical protein
MKRFIVLLLLSGAAFGQVAHRTTHKRSVPHTLQLSSYVRHLGLDYMDKVAEMDDSYHKSDEEGGFDRELATSRLDQIERAVMIDGSKDDKFFFHTWLLPLRIIEMESDAARHDPRLSRHKELWDIYNGCNAKLRVTLEDGTMDSSDMPRLAPCTSEGIDKQINPIATQ